MSENLSFLGLDPKSLAQYELIQVQPERIFSLNDELMRTISEPNQQLAFTLPSSMAPQRM